MAADKPYGDVAYADPKNNKYPIDTKAHAQAAWSYINQARNQKGYTPDEIAAIKARIKAALKRFGVDVSPDAGQGKGENTPARSTTGVDLFFRSFPLENIEIVRSTDGRTVEAYAAVFDSEAEIVDHQGHYLEVIERTAFNKAVNDARPAGSRSRWNVGVFYNHGLTLHGTPSDRFSVPLGVTTDIKVEARGLLTTTRYSETPLADEILQAIKDGSVSAQSFTGRIMRSNPLPMGGKYRSGRGGKLQTVRRTELGLREYGPTPFPAYADAAIVGVRSMQMFRPFSEDTVDEQVDEVIEDDTSAQAEAVADEPQEEQHSDRHSLLVSRMKSALVQRGISL